jgi:protein-tyrosine phosphatase
MAETLVPAQFMRPAGRPGLSPFLEGRLLIGEYPTPDDAAWLRDEHGVAAVLSLQDDADLASKNLELAALERSFAVAGLEFHRCPVPDVDIPALASALPAIVARLHGLLTAGARVYLHCNAGFNRAPTVAIAYLHVYCGRSLDEAVALVKQGRSCAPYRTALELCFARE